MLVNVPVKRMLVKRFCIRCWRRVWFIGTVYGSYRCVRCASLNRVTVLERE